MAPEPPSIHWRCNDHVASGTREWGHRLLPEWELALLPRPPVGDSGLAVTIDQTALLRHASEYEGKRDLLCHAIFVRDQAGKLMDRDAKRGKKWQPPGQRGQAVDKSIEPSGQKINAAIVAGLAENIALINRALEVLWQEIASQLSNSRHGKI